MIEQMAAMGILGEYKGSQAREVMIKPEDWERMYSEMEQERAVRARASQRMSARASAAMCRWMRMRIR